VLESHTDRHRHLPDADDAPREDHIVVLHDVTWADYQRLLAARGDRSTPRLRYLEGTLEIMSPSFNHEAIRSIIGRLVEAYCLDRDIEILPVGSWTLTNASEKRGVEPDECYVFGGVKKPKRPDLAIEVVWTSGGLDKLEIYKCLGIREVWQWAEGRIQMFALRNGRYARVRRSALFPELDLELLASFLDAPTAMQAVRAYRTALASSSRSPRSRRR
jgi:Uma2 family endonuclease